MKYVTCLMAIVAAQAVLATPALAAPPESVQDWFDQGQATIERTDGLVRNERRAKNVILFVGDGMGVSTVTAARILEGQLRGEPGEENQLAFETLPHLALSKTYSYNQQTSDSAPTMTAMVTGYKTSDGLLSVSHEVPRGDWAAALNPANRLETLLEQAEARGLSTGVVSTARITHATPAACYAHSPSRDWESDANVPLAARASYPDIARQLIELPVGNGVEVVLGGGRTKFIPNTQPDPEDAGRFGERLDGRNLPAEWMTRFGAQGASVWNKAGFDAVDPATTDHLLGLFERSHMEFEFDRAADVGKEPSLTEMTDKAIRILQKNKKGFFLHVESGRVDHAHHAGNAYRALTDAIEMSNAVRRTMEMVDMRDTLIIVTADHSHVFTIAGYPQRGNPILGKAVSPDNTGGLLSYDPVNYDLDMLGLPYTTLSYANGPGYTGASNQQLAGSKTFGHSPSTYTAALGRPNLTALDTRLPTYLQESTVPMNSETHAGEDVAIYAGGPKAHLFQGTVEQNVIYHVMADALGF